MVINATILIIKNQLKDNITYSKSFYQDGTIRSYNFTGSLTEVSNYFTADGKDISTELITANVPTTVIINNPEMGEAILEKAKQIFEERELNGDLNPAIELQVQAKSLKVPSNILISFVARAYVSSDAVLQDRASDVLANLKKASRPASSALHSFGTKNANQRATRVAMDMANTTRNENKGLFAEAGKFVKKYF